MTKLDWGTIPTEIIELISEIIVDQDKKSLDWRSINKNWYKSSLRSVFHSVTIDRGISGQRNNAEGRRVRQMATTRLKLFWGDLEKSQDNLGQNVKKFSCDFMEEYAGLIKAFLNFCPKVQVLEISLDQQLSDYIVYTYNKKKKEEGVVLWKDLQVLGCSSYYGKGAFVYPCFHTFRDTLTTLYVWIDTFNEFLDNSQGDQQQYMIEEDQMAEDDHTMTKMDDLNQRRKDGLSRYIGAFKKLKILDLNFARTGGFESIYDLEDYLFDCPSGLKSLRIDGGEERDDRNKDNALDNARADALSRYPQQIHSLKELSICKYTPQNTYYDLMYIKNKFMNVESLHITNKRWFRNAWTPVSDVQLDQIMNYLLSLRQFYVSFGYKVETSLVNKMFDSFIRHQRSNDSPHAQQQVALELSWQADHTYEEGIRMDCKDVATMQVDMYDHTPNALTNIHNIIKHVGPGINILKLMYCFYDYQDTAMDDFSRNLIDCILSECPKLQTLTLWGAEYIDINEKGPLYERLRTLKITSVNASRIQAGFFTGLSTRAPNLQNLTLGILETQHSYRDSSTFEMIMPSSLLKKMKINASVYYYESNPGDQDDSKDSDVALVEGLEVNLKLTITKESNDNGSPFTTNTTTFYHCHDDDPSSKQPNFLNWKHICNANCQHNDTDIFIRTRRTCINFSIVCKSVDILELETSVGNSKKKFILQPTTST